MTRIVLLGFGLITTVLVARLLGPEGRGLYAIAGAIGAIGVQFGNFGLHASNAYFLARKETLLPRLLANSLVLSLGLGGLGALLAWVLLTRVPALAPVQGLLLGLGLLSVPVGLAYLLMQGLLLGLNEFRAYNGIELAARFVGLILIGLVVAIGHLTVEAVYATTLVVAAVALALGVHRLWGRIGTLPRPSLPLFEENFRYGFKAYFSALFSFLVLRFDLLMVEHALGAEEAGFYSIAVTMADLMAMIPIAVGTILFPRLSGMSQPVERWRMAKQAVLGTTVFMLLLSGVAFLLAEPVVMLLFGEEFRAAVPAFQWLLPGILMLSINSLYMNYFASIGMPVITIVSPALAVVTNVGLNLWTIPAFGIVGASAASVAAYGLMLCSSLVYLSWKR